MTQAYSAARMPALDSLFVAAMPWLFVLIWSTGFVVAKFGMPYAEPITFLFLRFVGVLVCLLPLVWVARVPLPRRAGADA
ncbi:EamA family transporter, partial [Ralstonia pseudosolanacearum]